MRAGLSRPRIHGEARARRRLHPARRPHSERNAPGAAGRGARRAAQSPRQPRRAARPAGAGRRRPRRRRLPLARSRRDSTDARRPTCRTLEFFNGLGGFAADGEEYVTILRDGQWTPAPWINVIANPGSASRCRPRAAAAPGLATAARTSSRPGRTIRSATGRARRSTSATRTPASCWGPTALPIRDATGAYVARHGRGYSRFEHTRARHRARPAAVRAARRPGQDLAAAGSATSPAARVT